MVNKRLILGSPQPIRVFAQRIKVYGVVFSRSELRKKILDETDFKIS